MQRWSVPCALKDKIHSHSLMHLVRSSGVDAISRLFRYVTSPKRAWFCAITKQPAAVAVGCSLAERTRFTASFFEKNNRWKSVT